MRRRSGSKVKERGSLVWVRIGIGRVSSGSWWERVSSGSWRERVSSGSWRERVSSESEMMIRGGD